MTRIHVYSTNFSNPDSPPFPSQLFVLLWEPCSGPYLKLSPVAAQTFNKTAMESESSEYLIIYYIEVLSL